jgi:hypothetical protein
MKRAKSLSVPEWSVPAKLEGDFVEAVLLLLPREALHALLPA